MSNYRKDLHTWDGTKSVAIPYVFEHSIHRKLQHVYNSLCFLRIHPWKTPNSLQFLMFWDLYTLDCSEIIEIPYDFGPAHLANECDFHETHIYTYMTKLKLDKEVGGGDSVNSGIVCLVLFVVWFACVVCFVCFVLFELIRLVYFVFVLFDLFVLFCL